MDCVCHYPLSKTVETVIAVQTKEKENKLLAAAHRWIAIGKYPETEIAAKVIEMAHASSISLDSCFHPSCYREFSSETKLTRAAGVKRKKVCKLT